MKHRFLSSKKNTDSRNLIITSALFVLLCVCFLFASSLMSRRADEEEVRTLETAVMRGVTYCYALEGHYPENLTYLKENYGLQYDEEKYYVNYQSMGSNLMPDVTIVARKETQK